MDGLQLICDRRAFLAGGIASLGLPGLAGCSRGDDVEVVLGDQVHLVQAKLEAAGVSTGTSYRISWGNFPGAAPLLEALNAGAVDTAPAGDIPVILAAAAGCRLKIAAINRVNPESMAIIVPPGSPIRTVRDLAGQAVIVSSARGSISHYLLLEALREAGVDQSTVRTGFMPPNDAATAFATGQIAAWATFGIYQVKAELAGARILRDGRGIGPGFGLIAIAERALADPGKRGAIVDFLSCARRANAWCRGNPERYAAIYARRTGADLVVARKMVARENPGLAAPDTAFAEALQRAADRFRGYGVLPRRVDVRALIEPGLLKA